MTILDTARQAAALSRSVLNPRGLDYRSAGTKQLLLTEPISTETGYWSEPASISSKPPRWILQLEGDVSPPEVHLARVGSEMHSGASTPGYVNNGQGKCSIAAVRVLLAVRLPNHQFEFPEGWEWLVQFVFPQALPTGTSGDALTEFSVPRGTLQYKGRAAERREFSLAAIYVHPVSPEGLPDVRVQAGVISYRMATRALLEFLSSGPVPATVLDLAEERDATRLLDELRMLYAAAPRADVGEEVYESLLRRLSAGERGFLSQLAPSIYRVAPPSVTNGTAASSTSIATGDEIV